jgi:dTDP-4-dehydrorhamnose 3,5-epimerase-like enzyme
VKKQKTKLSYSIEIPKIEDEGFLSFLESKSHVPFSIKRLYYISEVIPNARRGFHAHKKTKQIFFCIQGSIRLILDNGKEREEIVLDQSNKGIFLDAMMWHEMIDFQPDTILLVVASDRYDEDDYIRQYNEFLKAVQSSD